MPDPEISINKFEELLTTLCKKITDECRAGAKFENSKAFELRVREVLKDLLSTHGQEVDFNPHPYVFPDIVLGKFGVEVKFTANDTWRSVANSVFEGTRDQNVKSIYIVFGKMGGEPEVRWGRYEECVIHVRTSHVPRFEVEVPPKRDSLFKTFNKSYSEFCLLSEHDRMQYVRNYARSRLEKGERLWWLEDKPDEGHTLELKVRRWRHLTNSEKAKLRAEVYLLCPEVLESRRGRQSQSSVAKYDNALMYLLTYHGVHAARDAFSAGSVGEPKPGEESENGGEYVKRAVIRLQDEIKKAAQELPEALFLEYWEVSVPPEKRIKEWLKKADVFAQSSDEPWRPSEVLFKES